jgi:hypothetical protein
LIPQFTLVILWIELVVQQLVLQNKKYIIAKTRFWGQGLRPVCRPMVLTFPVKGF